MYRTTGNKIYRLAVEGKLVDRLYIKPKTPIAKFFSDFFSGRYRKALTRRIDWLIQTFVLKSLSKNTPIQNNKIVFITTRGSFNCNPRAIAEGIIRQGLPWELVWVTREEELGNMQQFPKELKLVINGSYDFYKEAMSAKVWIDNSVQLSYLNVPKKAEQILIETWHGSLGLKSFSNNKDKNWLKKAAASGKRTNYCLSNSSFETELFKSTFWGNADIREYGHARNDILFANNADRARLIAENLRRELCLPDGVNVALYAPTFRDDKHDLSVFDIDYRKLVDSLSKRFGGDWIVIKRFHYEIKRSNENLSPVQSDIVVDVSDYRDIQDLLLITDVGITDYSSWVFDYMLSGKPAFLYACDTESFCAERGFLYPIETTPFPLAHNMTELVENILNFNYEDYSAACGKFIREKGCIEDGRAVEKTIELLKRIILQNQT